MCKIIGITGGKNKDRKRLAWLTAKTIEEQRRSGSFEKYVINFECWNKLAVLDPTEITSTDHVVLDSFGDHILDQVKQFCPVLIPYDLNDKYVIKHTLINPYTFELLEFGVIVPSVPGKTTADHLYKYKDTYDSAWLTLEQFILYFAHYVIKSAFGKNVWLNVAISTAEAMGSSDTRIYTDCKTQAEVDYIVKSGGKIISLGEDEDSFGDITNLIPEINMSPDIINTSAEILWNFVKDMYNYI